MKLDSDQIARFDSDGYLFLKSVFSPDEVAVLREALPALLGRDGPEVVREKVDAEAVRIVYGGHVLSETYRRLSLHPKLLEPVQQLLRDRVYIHQSRLNPKRDFAGGIWTWHQDFGTWHREDGMPEPHCIVTGVFLDDATAANAPLLVVPGTQRDGIVEEVTREEGAKGYTVMEVDRPTLARMVEANGLEALTGPAGSVVFMHCNLVHGSANNITPLPRAVLYMNYNATSNACTSDKRAWHHCNHDTTPLTPLGADCLTEMGDAAA